LKKAKIPAHNEKARRQQILNRAILTTTVIIIIAVSAYALSRPSGVVLPDYLNRCIPEKGKLVYSSNFQLQILVNRANFTIPAGIGVLSQTCVRPIHTFVAKTGPVTIYVDSDVNRTYTLKDFFLVWGATYGSTYATFNKDQIFTYQADSTHQLVMRQVLANETLVDPSFENYPLPKGGNTATNPGIQISYG